MSAELTPSLLRRATRHLKASDSVMKRLIESVGPCKLEAKGKPYRYLMRSVLYQQLSVASAAKIEERVKALGPGQIPAPKKILDMSDAQFRKAGLSRQKIAAFRSIATAFEGKLVLPRALGKMTTNEVIENVTQIRGVGDWTAHMLLIFSLGRADILPVGDYGLVKAVRDLYGLEALPKKDEFEEIASKWRPFASVASWYLWRSYDTLDF